LSVARTDITADAAIKTTVSCAQINATARGSMVDAVIR
jgi:hypothetical protein